MPHVRETTVYKFDELSDSAKERAREWWRAGGLDEWWEGVYEDAAECLGILGIDVNRKPVRTMGGTTRYEPAIYFSGFASQGDGACFECLYSYAKGSVAKITAHAPKDETLHRIAKGLAEIQRRYFYRIEARTEHFGHYYHSGCTHVSVQVNGEDASAALEQEVADLLRSAMDWVYSRLGAENDWLLADEQVDEAIRANEYEFTEDGRIA